MSSERELKRKRESSLSSNLKRRKTEKDKNNDNDVEEMTKEKQFDKGKKIKKDKDKKPEKTEKEKETEKEKVEKKEKEKEKMIKKDQDKQKEKEKEKMIKKDKDKQKEKEKEIEKEKEKETEKENDKEKRKDKQKRDQNRPNKEPEHNQPTKTMKDWSKEEIEKWLISNGYEDIAPFLRGSGEKLLRLSRTSLLLLVGEQNKMSALALYDHLHPESELAKVQEELQETKKKLRSRRPPIHSSTGRVKRDFPASLWKNFDEETSKGSKVDVKQKWKQVVKLQLEIPGENPYKPALSPHFLKILSVLHPNGKKNVHHHPHDNTQDSVPDFVIFSGEPPWNYNRNLILVDFEVKRRFNPKSALKTASYDGRPSVAFCELLRRSDDAFQQNRVTPYYGVVTDLEHIIFWKFEDSEDGKIKPYFTKPVKFMCTYTSSGKIQFPKDTQEIPTGFKMLCQLICATWKASAEPISIHNNKQNELYTILRPIGKGKNSIVLAAKDSGGNEVCIKMEPIQQSQQIENEIMVLPKLIGCLGVPKLIFHGSLIFRGEPWKAIVTDIVGEYSIADIPVDTIQIYKIAKEAIEILEQIHQRGILHKDIKPDHLVFSHNKLYLIDYGCAGPADVEAQYETPQYSSLSTFIGCPESEKMDFESLWFSLISLIKPLPWDATEDIHPNKMLRLKLRSLPDRKKTFPNIDTLFVDKVC
eukprot:TRINITY_DN7343_c0_g1_i2.p1 TRINITY_DN7343_c0_g1~~TRINITY_DN7343_c0_g1_i2.p1  ORF type:complete len:699 (+),score=179.91 TRINITY_DN7343_c0_g1_i2:26-2122(+)